MAQRELKLTIQAINNTKKKFDAVKGELKSLKGSASTASASMTGSISKSFNVMRVKAKSVFAAIRANWLATTASIVASVIIVRKAWDAAFAAARLEQSRLAFKNIAKGLGRDAEEAFAKINKASVGLISEEALVVAANRALAFKIPLEDIPKLLEISRAAAREMGLTTEFAFDKIVTGIGRASPLLIDDLGIKLKIGDANKKMAESLGKVVSQLTAQELGQAVLNETLAEGQEIVDRQNLSTLTSAENMQKAGVEATDLSSRLNSKLIPTFTRLSKLLIAMEPALNVLIDLLDLVALGFTKITNVLQIVNRSLNVLLIEPLALIEKGLNLLRGTNNTVWQDIAKDTRRGVAEAAKELAGFKEAIEEVSGTEIKTGSKSTTTPQTESGSISASVSTAIEKLRDLKEKAEVKLFQFRRKQSEGFAEFERGQAKSLEDFRRGLTKESANLARSQSESLLEFRRGQRIESEEKFGPVFSFGRQQFETEQAEKLKEFRRQQTIELQRAERNEIEKTAEFERQQAEQTAEKERQLSTQLFQFKRQQSEAQGAGKQPVTPGIIPARTTTIAPDFSRIIERFQGLQKETNELVREIRKPDKQQQKLKIEISVAKSADSRIAEVFLDLVQIKAEGEGLQILTVS